MESTSLGSLQENLPTIAVASPFHWGGNWPQNHDLIGYRYGDWIDESLEKVPYTLFSAALGSNYGLIAVGRQEQTFSFLQAQVGKVFVAPLNQGVEYGVSGMSRLKKHLAWALSPSRSACDLKDKLSGAF